MIIPYNNAPIIYIYIYDKVVMYYVCLYYGCKKFKRKQCLQKLVISDSRQNFRLCI